MDSLRSFSKSLRRRLFPQPPVARPSQPGYKRRLWDELYGDGGVENRLKNDVFKQFEQGKNLREALVLVELLLEHNEGLLRPEQEKKAPQSTLRKFALYAFGRNAEVLAAELSVKGLLHGWLEVMLRYISYLSFTASKLNSTRFLATKKSIY